jgi:hypothetical protein
MSATQQAVKEMLKTDRRNGYTYPSPLVAPTGAALAAGGSATQTLQFEVDSVFVWTKTSYHVDLAAAALTSSAYIIPLITVQIQDTATQRTMFFSPIPIATMAGHEGLPFMLPAPQIVTPAASLKFSFVNFSAATSYTNLQLLLHGYKYYGRIDASGQLVQSD